MNNYEEQTKGTSEQGYTTVSYPHEGGITQLEIPCQIDDFPSRIESSKLVATVKR